LQCNYLIRDITEWLKHVACGSLPPTSSEMVIAFIHSLDCGRTMWERTGTAVQLNVRHKYSKQRTQTIRILNPFFDRHLFVM